MQDEPARPLKRLRLRNQDGHASSSLANSSQIPGAAVMRRPKLEDAEVSQACAELLPESKGPTPEPIVEKIRPEAQPVLPQPLGVLGRSDLSPVSATKRAELDALTQQHLRDKGKEPLLPQVTSKVKRVLPVRSLHPVHFKEPNVDPGIILSAKQKVHDGPVLIRPKDEPFTDDMVHLEVPIAVIHPGN